MKNRLGWIGLLLSSILVSCPQVTPPAQQTPTSTAFKPKLLGSVTIDFDSVTKTAQVNYDHPQTRATNFPAESDLKFIGNSFSVLDQGANRFISAGFQVKNLNTTTDFNNLTLVAYHRRSVVGSENKNGSAFFNITDFGGSSSNADAWAVQLKPAHGMTTSAGNVVVDDNHADMQVFSPSEINTLETDANGSVINVNPITGEAVLAYGYVARNAANGRLIVKNTDTNSLTVGLKVPNTGDPGAGNTTYRYSETFLVFTDNVTRVTESLEEQGASGAVGRAGPLGATIAYLCGSSLTSGTFIPGAKTAGITNATAWLGGNIKITSTTAFGFSAIGNTSKTIADTSVLSHYASLDGIASLNSVVGLGAGTNSSTTLVGGNYIFNPNVGVTGAATFKYRVSDGASCTIPDQSADVSISNMVWYVDSSAAAGGDGRSISPFQNFNNVNGAGGVGDSDAPNDFIYVLKGTGYTSGLALETGQHLIGESVDLIVNSQTLRTATPANVPTITNGAGNGITLASGNTVSGFSVGNVSGTKLIGSSVGTATINNLTLNGSGAALNINGGNLAVTIDSLSSSSSTNAISLTGVAGSLTANAGAISGASGADVLISGGTANFTYAGSINNTSGRSVDIQSRTGGTATFSGAITDTANGIFLNSNTGSSINFTGGLNLSTTTNNAFTATGGGTVNATQNNTSIVNTLTTTTGTALNFSSTTIGGSGLTFRSISSNGAANGISLVSLGGGSLTVTGDGSGHANGSGGSISNAIIEAVHMLTNSGSITFTSMNFVMNTSAIDGILVDNNAGGTVSVNVTGCTFTGVTASVSQNKALLQFEAGGAANVTGNVQDTFFNSSRTYGLYATGAGTSTVNVTLNQSGFGTDVNTGAPVNQPGTTITNAPAFSLGITNSSSANVHYNLTNNTFWGASSALGALYAVTISGASTTGSATLNGFFNSNKIGKSGVANSGCSNNCAGLGLLPGLAGTFNVTANGNDIRQVDGFGINLVNNVGGGSTANVIAHFTNNTLDEPVTGGGAPFLRAIVFSIGNSGGSAASGCAEITGNTINGAWTAASSIRISVINTTGTLILPGLSPTSGATTTQISAFVKGNNTLGALNVLTSLVGGISTGTINGGGACASTP